jgi:hypothetical protein
VFVLLGIGAAIGGSGSTENSSTKTVSVERGSAPSQTEEASDGGKAQSVKSETGKLSKPKKGSTTATISDGHWQRGVDYEAGTYRAPGGEYCEWAQAETAEAVESGSGHTFYGKNLLIELKDKFFRTEGCGMWEMQAPSSSEDEANRSASPTTISDGHWKKGTDYEAGLYRAPGGEYCEWAQGNSPASVESGSGHTFYGVNLLAEIEDPYFRSEECGTWKKVEGGPEGDKIPTETTIPDGHWRSGTDFQPGTYRAPGGEYCEWAQGSSANGVESGSGQTHYGKNVLAEITEEFFRTEECGVWKLVG